MFSCDNKDDGNNLFKVDGIVYQNGEPVNNAKVTIDNTINYTTYTNQNGEFIIENVNEGAHSIEIYKESQNDTNSYTMRTYDTSINSNTTLNNLELPTPVILLNPEQLSANSITLNWNPTDASDFREYKVYKHSSSGLDQNTGELIHVSTELNSTSFVYEGSTSMETYYFRVFIMNDFGLLAGSNIVSITTANLNIFPDGGFEQNDTQNFWTLSGFNSTWNIDSTIKHDGSNSLHISIDPNSLSSHGKIEHLQFNNLTTGVQYKFSFWYRFDGINNDCSDIQVDFEDFFQFAQEYPLCSEPGYLPEQWYYYESTFVSDQDNFVFYTNFSNPFSDLWVDDFILKRI